MAVKNMNCEKVHFEDALDKTGFGRYNMFLLLACCLLILAMYIDIFGFSIVLPSVACDMNLTTRQQGLLSAVPLIGVMLSSYAWGLCADTFGRRSTLLVAMPVNAVMSLAASIAPTYLSLAILKFLSASFSSSANAAGFVLLGESMPSKYRSRFMFLMASATMCVQFLMSVIALPVLQLTFHRNVPLINLDYRPWRLFLQIVTIPGILGIIGILFLHESPKFLLSKGKEIETIEVLKSMHRWNNKRSDELLISSILLEKDVVFNDSSILRKIWDQTAPLFKPPLLKNSLKLYFILLCAFMTSTGYTMWVPTMTNAYFVSNNSTGRTFCEVASTAAAADNSVTDCNNIIKPMALFATMIYSGVSGCVNVLLSFLVVPLGKKRCTMLVFSVSIVSGIMLLFVRQAVLSIGSFFLFLYVALILGNINTYLVELNPTHLRGMATCLSVVIARGFGFFSVQIIASLLGNFCQYMIGGYIALEMLGLMVALFLPSDARK